MRALQWTIISLAIIVSAPIFADDSATVRLTIVPPEAGDTMERVIIERQTLLSGNNIPNRIELTNGEKNTDAVQAIAIEGSLSEARQTAGSGSLVAVVGANLLPEKDLSDHAHFRALESHLIRRYGGKVLLSLSTQKTSVWPFDILELVSFPSLEHYRAMMVDPDYAPETSIGSTMTATYSPDVNVVTAKLK